MIDPPATVDDPDIPFTSVIAGATLGGGAFFLFFGRMPETVGEVLAFTFGVAGGGFAGMKMHDWRQEAQLRQAQRSSGSA